MLIIPLDLVTSITAIALEQVCDKFEPADTQALTLTWRFFSNDKLYDIKEHEDCGLPLWLAHKTLQLLSFNEALSNLMYAPSQVDNEF